MQKENYFPERWRSSTQHEGDFNMISVVTWATGNKHPQLIFFMRQSGYISNIHDFKPHRKWGVSSIRSHRFKEGHLLRSEFRMFFCYREATVSLVATFEWETWTICWPSNINQALGFLVNLLATHRNHGVFQDPERGRSCKTTKQDVKYVLKGSATCEFFVMRIKGHHPKNATYPEKIRPAI